MAHYLPGRVLPFCVRGCSIFLFFLSPKFEGITVNSRLLFGPPVDRAALLDACHIYRTRLIDIYTCSIALTKTCSAKLFPSRFTLRLIVPGRDAT